MTIDEIAIIAALCTCIGAGVGFSIGAWCMARLIDYQIMCKAKSGLRYSSKYGLYDIVEDESFVDTEKPSP